MVIPTDEKESLQNRQVSWICCHCSNPNFDSSLFSNSSIELSNSFSMLSSDDYTDSLSSPLATSSPYKQRNNTKGDIRANLRDTGVHFATTYSQETHAKRHFLKTLVINFCSTKNKVADLAVCIGKYNPDTIIGTETHLDNSVNSSELFPSNYSVIRKDRNFDNSKGGVLIAMKDLNSLMKWEYDWQMHFNPQTCFVMRLTHARHLTRFNYILRDTSLQETDNHPYLGVHITKDLTCNKHIHQITATATVPLHS